MSARSRDARRFDPLADIFEQVLLDMGQPTQAERIRRSARMQLARLSDDSRADLADLPAKRSCA